MPSGTRQKQPHHDTSPAHEVTAVRRRGPRRLPDRRAWISTRVFHGCDASCTGGMVLPWFTPHTGALS